jgi:hypothetical protein
MTLYPESQGEPDDYARSRGRFEQIVTRLGDEEMMGCTEQCLEEYVNEVGRELKRQLIQDQLDARSFRENRLERVVGDDLVARRRVEPGHRRLVATTVGRVEVSRMAYRSPGVANLHPADARLALPERVYSFPLRERVVGEVARGSLRVARDSLEANTGQRIGYRQLMQIVTESARDVSAFYQRPERAPLVRVDGQVLVMSIDSTGVTMIPRALRHPGQVLPDQGARPPSAQLSSRERGGRSRMAVVTAVYDAAVAVRGAADVVPLNAAERAGRRRGPKATGRRLDASLVHSVAPMVVAMFDQAEQRDPGHRRRWIVLVDGANHQLECIKREARKREVEITIIIDFIHVLEYVWKAAEDLHPTQPTRVGFVQATARELLEGHAPRVIADLSAHLRARDGDGVRSPGLGRTIEYLRAKQDHLDYHIALALGWPIATGVIEGACRFLVKDRLDITGARWGLAGAEAVLLLRAVIANGDFNDYWRFHVRQEYERTHAVRYKDQVTLAA